MEFAFRPDRSPAAPHLAPAPPWARAGLASLALLVTLALAGAAPGFAADEVRGGTELVLTGMTYVASEGSANDLVLDAERARLPSGGDQAQLEGVRARFGDKAPGGDASDVSGGLDLVCDHGTFDLETRDFVAEGNVRGTTSDGRRFRTDGLRYNHEEGLVSTDRPVVIRDNAGTYRGGGFDYYVREDRFRLRGGAQVVQEAP